eukprot:gnl/MRDRNA2_/MRDRNA2_30540_c0_seq1.p1 gnl/MRDRNA2_/MRDRNA2_30540_c0~~gnl/MRDRNA2_/MRDRNA2_30540_c0_seq1.p1  ORF type:complete len:1227 (-),score=252.13 gnl/MRDRNA2_/MRDRNA2_30540_c0_seq1:141-3821(-)
MLLRQMICAISAVVKSMEHSNGAIRDDVIQEALPRVAQKGNEAMITEVAARLEHPHEGVRQAAVEALHMIAPRNNVQTIDAVVRRLEHPNRDARAAAIEACARIVDKGFEPAIMRIVSGIVHDMADVRNAVVEALAVVAGTGDDSAIRALLLHFGHTSPEVIHSVLQALCRVVQSDDACAVSAMVTKLEDPSLQVRRTAVEALRLTVAQGDLHAVNEITRRLHHKEPEVRSSALEALKIVMTPSDSTGIAKIVSCFADPDMKVQEVAVNVFVDVVTQGDSISVAIDAVLSSFEHWEEAVRETSMEALRRIVQPGDNLASEKLTMRLEHFDRKVRQAAAVALGSIVSQGNVEVIKELLARFKHPHDEVKDIAIEALVNVVEQGDMTACTLVIEYLEDENDKVRKTAVEALGRIAQQGHAQTITAIAALLENPDANARQAAGEALGRVSKLGDANVVAEVCKRLEHNEGYVRQTAVTTIGSVIEQGDAEVIAAVAVHLGNPEQRVRDASVLALLNVAKPGDENVVTEVVKRLEHQKAGVRMSAAAALSEVAPPDSQFVIDSVIARLEHRLRDVRLVAVHALEGVASKGNPQVLKALLMRLKHTNPDVRHCAAEAVNRMAMQGDQACALALVPLIADVSQEVQESAECAFCNIVQKGDDKALTAVRKHLQNAKKTIRVRAVGCLARVAPDLPARGNLMELCGKAGNSIPTLEDRGITVKQSLNVKLYIEKYCRKEEWFDRDIHSATGTCGNLLTAEAVNFYHACDWIIRPATEQTRLSYVERVIGVPQKAKWFVSHWWGLEVVDFMKSIKTHQVLRCLNEDDAYWAFVFAHSLWPGGEEAGAANDQIVNHVTNATQGTVLLLDKKGETFTRAWCLYEVWAARKLDVLTAMVRKQVVVDCRNAAHVKHDVEAVGMIDGIAPVDGQELRRRSQREQHFPKHLSEAALQIALNNEALPLQATVDTDKEWIVRAMDGAVECDVVNGRLQGRFAAVFWSIAVAAGSMGDFPRKLKASKLKKLSLILPFMFSDADMEDLAEGLPDTLQELFLAFEPPTLGVTDTGMIELGETLRKAPDLTNLTIHFPAKCTNKGSKETCSQLKHLHSLRSLCLDFSGCVSIGDAGIEQLLKTSRSMVALQSIKVNLAGTKVTKMMATKVKYVFVERISWRFLKSRWKVSHDSSKYLATDEWLSCICVIGWIFLHKQGEKRIACCSSVARACFRSSYPSILFAMRS